MTKRAFYSLFTLGWLGAMPLWAQQVPELVSEQGYADLVLVNGKIVSMDDRSTRPDTPGQNYQSMAIKGKRIMALGSNQEMRKLAGPATRFLDVGSRTVIPGLIQTHHHTFLFADLRYGPEMGLLDPSIRLTVTTEATAEATAKKVRDAIINAIRVQNIPAGKWIRVNLQESEKAPPGHSRTWLYLGKLNKRQLEGVTEEHPVLVSNMIQGIINDVAIAEIKKDFPDWEESTDIENRPGASTDGYVAVPEIFGLSWNIFWKDEPLETFAEMLRLHGVRELVPEGVTTIATRLLYPATIAAYHLLNRENRMPHRVAYYVESQRGEYWGLKTIREFYKGTGAPWSTHSSGNEMLWLNGMCNEIWDSNYNEKCLGPDFPDVSEEVRMRERCPSPGTKPWESIKTAIVHGWRPVQVHGTSSHGARLYIQMLEQAMEEGNYSVEYMKGLRTTLEHNMVLGKKPDVMAGIKKFGIILNVNPGMLGEVPDDIENYGEGIRDFIMPVKTWIEQGIRVTFEAAGSDFWTPIHILVTREVRQTRGIATPGGKPLPMVTLVPEEAIDRVTALKMATTWASEYMMGEDTIGTLEPGKFADFAILDRDFFTIPVAEIPEIEVVLTGLGGQIIYDEIN